MDVKRVRISIASLRDGLNIIDISDSEMID